MARKATVRPDGAVVVVTGHRAGQTLSEHGLRPLYVRTAGGWLLDARRAADVVAVLERAGYDVQVGAE